MRWRVIVRWSTAGSRTAALRTAVNKRLEKIGLKPVVSQSDSWEADAADPNAVAEHLASALKVIANGEYRGRLDSFSIHIDQAKNRSASA